MSNGNLLLVGDLNVYLPRGVTDFIEGDIMDDHVPLPDDVYQPDIPIPGNEKFKPEWQTPFRYM